MAYTNAKDFINGWSGSESWERELVNKTTTVEIMLQQLRDLDRDEPTEGVDWEEVENELERIANHTHRPNPHYPEHCAECGEKL